MHIKYLFNLSEEDLKLINFEKYSRNDSINYLLESKELSDKLCKYLKYINLNYGNSISEEYIRKYSEYIDFRYIYQTKESSSEFLEEFADKLNWVNVSYYWRWTSEAVEKNKKHISFPDFTSRYYNCKFLTDDMIEKNQRYLYWYNVISFKSTEKNYFKFLLTNKDWINWNIVSRSKLSMSIIWRFRKELNIYHITSSFKLSESFINKYPNLVDWRHIANYYKLSSEFKRKHRSRLSKYKVKN